VKPPQPIYHILHALNMTLFVNLVSYKAKVSLDNCKQYVYIKCLDWGILISDFKLFSIMFKL
jgi:hypothetical protein